jgi:hypothetical protein
MDGMGSELLKQSAIDHEIVMDASHDELDIDNEASILLPPAHLLFSSPPTNTGYNKHC